MTDGISGACTDITFFRPLFFKIFGSLLLAFFGNLIQRAVLVFFIQDKKTHFSDTLFKTKYVHFNEWTKLAMEMRPFFQGRWHLSRTILNLKSKKIMMESISGTCLFNETITSEEEELLYTEELMMTQCETSSTMLIPASRQYLYSFPTNCDSFDMYFYKNEKPQAHFQRLKKQKEEEESMHHFSGLHDC